jgi:hypothetical protein
VKGKAVRFFLTALALCRRTMKRGMGQHPTDAVGNPIEGFLILRVSDSASANGLLMRQLA